MDYVGKNILCALFENDIYGTDAFSPRNVLGARDASFLCYTKKHSIHDRIFNFARRRYILHFDEEIPQTTHSVAVYLASILCNYKNNIVYDYIVSEVENKIVIYEFLKDDVGTDIIAAEQVCQISSEYGLFFNTKKIQDWSLNDAAACVYSLKDDNIVHQDLKDLRWIDRREMILIAFRIRNGHFFHIFKYVALFL